MNRDEFYDRMAELIKQRAREEGWPEIRLAMVLTELRIRQDKHNQLGAIAFELNEIKHLLHTRLTLGA